MVETYPELFSEFKKINDSYGLDEDKFQAKLNEVGAKVVEIVNEWENKLCSQSEKGGYAQFTPKLAEKFREEVRKLFPFIDYVGIQVSYVPIKEENIFNLKKIQIR